MSYAAWKRSLAEFIRFGLAGIANNLGGYLIYLAVTWAGVDPKLTVAVIYPIGVLVNYYTHLRYSFGVKGSHRSRMPRYIMAQIIGLLTNVAMLAIFVNWLGFGHELVQLVAIGVVGLLLFALMKFFVFSPASTHVDQGVARR